MSDRTIETPGAGDDAFLTLLLRHMDQSISEDETTALHAELARDVERRRQFVNFYIQCARLGELLRPQISDDRDESPHAGLDDAQILPALNLPPDQAQTTPVDDDIAAVGTRQAFPVAKTRGTIAPRQSGQPFWRKPWAIFSRPAGTRGWSIAASALLVSAVSLVLVLHYLGVMGRHAEPFVMGASLDAVWADPSSVAAEGSFLKTGVQQSLSSGCAELTAANGLRVIVQGPASFTLEKPNVLTLASGRLTASVPKPAHGFTVNTPTARIVDLGTEFGVAVAGTGGTDVQTFVGTVSVAPTVTATDSAVIFITAGHERRISSAGDVTEITADATAFVRAQQFDDWKAMPRKTSYERWWAYSQRLRSDPDLVAYYTFDKDAALPESLVNEAPSGAALNGILLGTDRIHERPAWATGRWREKGALAFGPNGHERVEIPASGGGPMDFSRGEQTAAPFTICAWIRNDDPRHVHSSIMLWGGGLDLHVAVEVLANSSIVATVGDAIAAGPQAKVNGNWQQLAMCYDPAAGKLELYLNGELVAANSNAPRQLPPNHASWPLAIGNRQFNRFSKVGYLPPMVGRVDELAVFRRSLSAEEVKAMYQEEKPD